jgi:hypothetical protein
MITGNLEYIMCSLPNLSFHDRDEERQMVFSILKKYKGPSEMDKSIIVILEEEVSKFLSPKEFRLYQQIDLKNIHSEVFRRSKNKVLKAFSTYVFLLKKQIQQLRISRKNRVNPSTTKKPLLPLIEGTPLEEEIQLMKWQWEKLEELSVGHFADFGALCLYKLKLLILIRLWSFDKDRGFDNFLNIIKKTEDGR